MKVLVSFSLSAIYSDSGVSSELVSKLCEIHPEGLRQTRGGPVFDCKLSQDDPKLPLIFEILKAHNKVPSSILWRAGSNEFSMQIERHYDVTDWEAAPLLQPWPKSYLSGGLSRNEKGLLKIPAKVSKTDIGIAIATWAWIAVSGSVREKMEKEGLKRVAFREVELLGKMPEKSFPIFELASDLILPPMNQTISKWMNNNEQPFDGDYNKGCFLKEGIHLPAEFHYKASDLTPLGPFDVAFAREQCGNKAGATTTYLVVSKRFYEFCKRNKFKIHWWPVRIDPD